MGSAGTPCTHSSYTTELKQNSWKHVYVLGLLSLLTVIGFTSTTNVSYLMDGHRWMALTHHRVFCGSATSGRAAIPLWITTFLFVIASGLIVLLAFQMFFYIAESRALHCFFSLFHIWPNLILTRLHFLIQWFAIIDKQQIDGHFSIAQSSSTEIAANSSQRLRVNELITA